MLYICRQARPYPEIRKICFLAIAHVCALERFRKRPRLRHLIDVGRQLVHLRDVEDGVELEEAIPPILLGTITLLRCLRREHDVLRTLALAHMRAERVCLAKGEPLPLRVSLLDRCAPHEEHVHAVVAPPSRGVRRKVCTSSFTRPRGNEDKSH